MQPDTDSLQAALDWLGNLIASRIGAYLRKDGKLDDTPLAYYRDDSWLDRFVRSRRPCLEELAVLLLALAPHLRPGFCDRIIAGQLPQGGDFPEFGGVKGPHHRGILPTGETAQFLLGGDSLQDRLAVQRLLAGEHWFARERMALAPRLRRRIALRPARSPGL